jgi:hypothetical protein
MQVTSSSNLAAQLGTLENAARSKYQDRHDFSFVLDQALQSSPSINNSTASQPGPSKSSSTNGWELSANVSSAELIAVGRIEPDGTVVPYSQQQIQSEQDTVDSARRAAYDNALHNFLALSQAGGQLGAGTLTDHEQFTTANGLVSGQFDTSFSLKAVTPSTS